MAEETALDVMNTALGDLANGTVTSKDPDPPADDPANTTSVVPKGDDPDAGEPSTTDDPEGKSGEGDDREGEPDGEGGELADIAVEAEAAGVSLRNADGTFKSHEQVAAEVAAAKSAKPEGDKPVDRKGAKKEPDPVNDPIPAGLKKETSDRIRTLIDRTKDAEGRADKATQDFNYLVQGVQSTGASPEQYGETLSWLSLFNSGDPTKQAQALDIIEGVADRLATMLGKERTIVDPLAAHADLKTAVQAGQITKQFATETARLRNQGVFRQQMSTALTAQQQAEQAALQEKETARVALNQLEVRLQASDPQYEAKRDSVMASLKAAFKRLPPSQWVDAFNDIYATARVIAAPQSRRSVPTHQPLRAGKNPAGAGAGATMTTAPKSALDAMNAALAGMGK